MLLRSLLQLCELRKMETQSSWHCPIQVDAFIMYGHEYMGTLVAMVALWGGSNAQAAHGASEGSGASCLGTLTSVM